MAELEEQLSVDEFTEWAEWFRLDAELRKKATEKARRASPGRKR